MKITAVLSVLLLMVPLATGREIQPPLFHFFFTNGVTQPYGLTIVDNAFDPTKNESLDATSGQYVVSAFPGLEIDATFTPQVDWTAGEFAYLWFRFGPVPANTKVSGMHLDLDGAPTSVAYYVVDDLLGENGAKRWDGQFGLDDINFKQDPQILAGVVAIGLQNRATPIQNWNLYDHTTRTALLGAVRYESNGLRSLSLGSHGLSVKGYPPQITLERSVFGSANWIPEPAVGVVLALGAAALGRTRAVRTRAPK